jgi:hypothetical protein
MSFTSEEAFERTSFDTIKQANERQCTEHTIRRWVCTMLESRTIISTLLGRTFRVSAGRCALASAVRPGCQQSSLRVNNDDSTQ